MNSLTAVSGSFKGVKNVALKLKGNVLSGGVYYRFKLNVVDIGGIKASAVYDIRTNTVPTTGRYYSSSFNLFIFQFVHPAKITFSSRSAQSPCDWKRSIFTMRECI